MILEIYGYWSDGGVLLLPIAGVALMIFLLLRNLSRDFKMAVAEAEAIEERLGVGTGHTARRRLPTRSAVGSASAPARRENATPSITVAVFDAIDQRPSGQTAREQIESILRVRRAALEGRITILAALTAAAPLLGLLGTVSGMTTTFAGAAGIAADPAREVAGGIGVALMTTQYGLMVALPGVFGLARIERLRSRLRRSDGTISVLAALDRARGGEPCLNG